MAVLVIKDGHGRCSLLLEEGVRVHATTCVHAPANTATLVERAAALVVEEAQRVPMAACVVPRCLTDITLTATCNGIIGTASIWRAKVVCTATLMGREGIQRARLMQIEVLYNSF